MQIEDRAGLGPRRCYDAIQQIDRRGRQGPGAGRRLLRLPDRRAQDRRRRRPREGARPGRGAGRPVRHHAGLSGLALRQRLQPLRPHLSGQRPGRPALPPAAEDIAAPADPQRRGRRWSRWAPSSPRSETTGPERTAHYNGYPTAEINGGPAPGYSHRPGAEGRWRRSPARTLPNGMGYEWTELTYQQILAGNTAIYVFPLCVLLVFLVLAAQYESWTLPLAVILIVPMCLLSRPGRRAADRRRQQHLHPDRPDRAGRPGLQERHPDRGVRPRAGSAGRSAWDAVAGRVPPAPAADPDDLVRLHHGRRARW